MSQALLRKGKIALFFLVLLICDALTKYYTHLYIPKTSFLYPAFPYGGIAVFQDFFHISLSLNYIQNVGAAWGLFASFPKVLFFSRIVIVLVLFVWTIFFNHQKHRDLPLFLILTGALGNIIDTMVYGHVVDMIHFTLGSYSCPVFNLADMMITTGISWLFLLSFTSRECKCHD